MRFDGRVFRVYDRGKIGANSRLSSCVSENWCRWPNFHNEVVVITMERRRAFYDILVMTRDQVIVITPQRVKTKLI
jgi:hypothetical protein